MLSPSFLLLLSLSLLLPLAHGQESKGKEPSHLPGTTKIVGGTEVTPFAYPWMGVLTVQVSRSAYLCGVTLIASQWGLTAAHCLVQDAQITGVTVQFRRHDLDETAATENAVVPEIEAFVVDGRYNLETFHYDVALIKFRNPVTSITPIAIDRTNLADPGDTGYIMGWGTTSYEGYSSDVLLEASIRIWDFSDCNELYGGLVRSIQICAGTVFGTSDTCQGDSGGPLILNLPNNPVQVGVVSFGYKCAEASIPGVYTRVEGVTDFIDEAMNTATFNNCASNPCAAGFCFETPGGFYCSSSSSSILTASILVAVAPVLAYLASYVL